MKKVQETNCEFSASEVPQNFFAIFFHQAKKCRLTLVFSLGFTIWLGVSTYSKIHHFKGIYDLDFGIINWFSQIYLSLAVWGIILGWRVFAGERFARWGKPLAAKFLLLVIWVAIPAFGLAFAGSRIWPAILSNPQGYHSFIDSYAQSASLVALVSFGANGISPGLVTTIVSIFYGGCLALTGAVFPSVTKVLFVSAVLLVTWVIAVRPRFETGRLKWAQRLSFAFMALFLVIIPVILAFVNSFFNIYMVEEAISEESYNCAKIISEKKPISADEIHKLLMDSYAKGVNPTGGDPIFRKARLFSGLFGIATFLFVGLFVKRFWNLQARFEDVGDQLAAKTSELESILRGTREGIIVLRGDDSILFVNEPFSNMLGLSLEEFSGKLFSDLLINNPHIREKKKISIPGDPLVDSFFDNSISRVNLIELEVFPRETPDDGKADPRILLLNCGWVRDSSGRPIASVGVLHDVSFERRANEAKTEFVRHVAHEFRTPLTSIHAYTEMLLDGEVKDPATVGEYHGIVLAETQRLMRMIDDLLDIARIESGRRELKIEYVDIAGKIRQAVSVLDSQIKKKEMTCEVTLPDPIPGIQADPDLVEQTLLNVVGNSVKYTPQKGKINISMDWDPEFARISIADNGIGVSPENQKKLFSKFFRISSEETKGIVGTGLGLAAVKSIMEAHHGTVEVKSDLGKGSVFTLSFPMKQPADTGQI